MECDSVEFPLSTALFQNDKFSSVLLRRHLFMVHEGADPRAVSPVLECGELKTFILHGAP
jgi:hypothetical protein